MRTNPNKRLTVIHPMLAHKHLLLPQFVFEPAAEYVRFHGESLDEQDLFNQITDAVPNLESATVLVLDECDRANPQSLEMLLITLLKQYSTFHIVIFSRTFPQSLADNPLLSKETQIVMHETKAHSQGFDINPSTPYVEVYAMGSGRVFVNGSEIIDWDGHLPRNLFFFMIDNPTASIDDILETLWSDMCYKNATNIFHVTKATLHEVLGFQLIEYYNESYRINPNMVLYYDVQDFVEKVQMGVQGQHEKCLAEAQGLFRYNFLQNHDSEWVYKRRDELFAYYMECIEALANIKCAKGDVDSALHLYHQVWRANQLREDIAAAIMQIHLQLNEAEKALGVYWQTFDYVNKTVGIPLDKSLQQLGDMAQQQSIGVQITHRLREKSAS